MYMKRVKTWALLLFFLLMVGCSNQSTTEETANLYYDLDKIGILQFVRSGRIAITKSPVEKLNNYLAYRKEQYEDLKNKNGK